MERDGSTTLTGLYKDVDDDAAMLVPEDEGRVVESGGDKNCVVVII